MPASVEQHAAFPGLFAWMGRQLRQIAWWMFLIPGLVGGLMAYATLNDFRGWGDDEVLKGLLEVAHTASLFCMVLVAFQGYRLTADRTFRWLFLLALVLLGRELHFDYSGSLVWVALLVLAWLAWRERAEIGNLFERVPSSLFLVAVCTYATSETLDFLTEHGFAHWRALWESNTEEVLETCGGVLLMLLPLYLKPSSRDEQQVERANMQGTPIAETSSDANKYESGKMRSVR